MSRGWSNFRFGNARTTLNGGGGSGEPTTREVVQGTRGGRVDLALPGRGPSSAAEPSHVTNPAASASAPMIGDRRFPSSPVDGMSSTPRLGSGRRAPLRYIVYSITARGGGRIPPRRAAIPSGPGGDMMIPAMALIPSQL